jgi:hypothetical protein
VGKDQPRFFCKREPCGKWAVWDSIQNIPATLGGGPLRGREEMRARSACKILNAIYRSELDAHSVRERNCVQARSGTASDGARHARSHAPRISENTSDRTVELRPGHGLGGHIRNEFSNLKAAGRDRA